MRLYKLIGVPYSHPQKGPLDKYLINGPPNIDDKFSGDFGLSFPRIEGTSPFIRLARCISLEIVSTLHNCQLEKLLVYLRL